jgi:hypothetical protein
MRVLCFLLAWMLTAEAIGQETYYNDAQLRLHLDLEAKLTKRFSVRLDQQYRINQNISNFYRGAADLGVIWKPNKHVRVMLDYVYIRRKNAKDFWYQRNWYYAAILLRKDFGNIRLSYRNLLQFRGGNVNSDDGGLYKIYDRSKVTMRYEASKRVSPYVSGEIYVPLNNPQFMGIDRVRGQLGMSYNVTKNQQIDLYFMYQAFLQDGGWWDQDDRPKYLRRDYIYGIGYSIGF